MLTKQDIRQRLEVKPVEREVEELGGSVYLREFVLEQRHEFRKMAEAEGGDFNADLWLVMNGVVDEGGDLLFSNGDEEWLLKHSSGRLVTSIAKEVLFVNGWDDGALEEAEGN